ncbi:MAG: succinate dehydrogenase, hydrophobic membrane anchor protein [Rhodospirillaceae bacterium]|nr:succinate dehydrogenase, hydrophobic membrane anchor protein [Rhodospirillaceae bacterium]|tara:strand:- start:178 stop:627 length:450 start_codon:yes stop_codon:yes gene_type:complete
MYGFDCFDFLSLDFSLHNDGSGVVSLQSPLSRVRGLGSAKNGTHHWWMQRVTAVALVPLIIWFAIALIGLTGASYEAATTWMQSPFNAIMMVLLIIATFHHMQLGLQVVIEDYVHNEGVKVLLMLGQKLLTFALAIAAGFAVLKIAFGG